MSRAHSKAESFGIGRAVDDDQNPHVDYEMMDN